MVRFLAAILVRILFRIKVQGEIPKKMPGKTVIISNHQSFFDGILLGLQFPFRPTWVVHSTIARQWHFKILMKAIDYVIVDAANPLAMKGLIQAIEAGKPVMIFPEGRISTTGSLMKVYDGPAFLVAKTNARILPVFIRGASNSYFGRTRPPYPRKLRPEITLTFFPPRDMEMPEGRTGRERRRRASENLSAILEDMAFHSLPRTSLYETVLDAIDLYGKGTTILQDIRLEPETYGHFIKASMALGRMVSRLAKEGEAVGVLMPNVTTTISLLFGMFAMRRIPAMMNYSSGVEGMQSAIETAKIKTILTSKAFLEKAKLTEKVAQLKNVEIVQLEDLRPTFSLTDKLWLMLWAVRNPRAVMLKSEPSDPAIILFTSGSEGKPKGVVLSHKAILSNVAQMKSVFEFSNKDRFFVALPLFHSFGLTAGAILPMLSGVRIFLYPSPLHYRMVPEMVYDQDCTVMFGTGTFLANYARFAHPYDFYSMRYVVAGAEKLDPQVRATWMNRFGIRIFEGYGATECAPVVACNSPMFNKEGTVGRILPGLEHKLESIEGLENGKVLHVKGPNVMLGYYFNHEPGVLVPPESQFGPGWYNTGDVVEIDDRGYVRILERVKRFAKVAGEMVSLEVVEKIAKDASPKKEHAATIISDSRRGEQIILFTEDKELRRDQLITSARSMGQPEVAVARKIVPIDKLPRLGSGKVDAVALKKIAKEDETLAPVRK